MEQRGPQHVVTVADDVGLDLDRLADRPLHRVPAVIDLRTHREHQGARGQLMWKFRTHAAASRKT
jgi:hypothetical protein